MLEQEPELYVLDVRPLACDQQNIFIKEAEICPMVYLSDWCKNIPKDKKIVIADWANKKSILAAKFLITKGYNVIYVLKGGMVRWQDENLPVEYIENPFSAFTKKTCPD